MSRKNHLSNQKITALYCRISLDDGSQNESMSISNQYSSTRNMFSVILNKLLFGKRGQIPIFSCHHLQHGGRLYLGIDALCGIKFNISKTAVIK